MIYFGLLDVSDGHIEGGYNLNEDDQSIMQFTGLTDREGKYIFEGDIVEFKGHYTGKRTIVSKVVWSDSTSRWVLRYGPERDYASMWPEMVHWMEVIGNIHESPELLEPA